MPAAAGGGGGHEAVFIAGALSGLAEGITIQPLEMLKTRFQINSGARMRLLLAVREILAEGGVRQLYRGGLPEIAGLMPRAAAAMSTLELSRRWCLARGGGLMTGGSGGSSSGGGSSTAAAVTLTPAAAYATGALSGVSEGLAFAPFQVVKVRLMAREHLGKYANTFDCLTKLLREEGPRALFIGLAPTLWRNCVWNALYYGSVHQVEQRLPPLENGVASAVRSVVVGTVIGIFATVFNAPFDVVKSRFQSELPGNRRFTRVFPSLAKIAREEGPTALYRGFVPKALRLGIGQSVGLLTFQRTLAWMGPERGAHTAADDAAEARVAALIASE